MAIARRVSAVVLCIPMETPVFIEISVGPKSTELEHGLGPGERPTSPGLIHSIAHEITARALDNSRGDRQPRGERVSVAEQVAILAEIVGTHLDRFSVLHLSERSAPSHSRRDIARRRSR